MMRTPFTRSLPAAIAVMAVGFAAPAAAQDEGPNLDSDIPIQQFAPMPGGDNNFVTVGGSRVLGNMKFAGGLYFNYANDPLILGVQGSDQQVALVRHQIPADLIAAFGLLDILELGVRIPVTLFQTAERDPTLATKDIGTFTVGDIMLVPKWSVLPTGDQGAGFALAVPFTIPTAPDGNLAGNASATVEPRAVVEYQHSPAGIRFAANVGYLIRQQQDFVNIDVGNELTYGAAYQHPVLPEKWFVIAELFGKAGIDRDNPELIRQELPLEFNLSTRYRITENHAVTAGAGAGIIAGYGTPRFRVLLAYTFTQNKDPDADGDGIPDNEDACPADPEDRDGFEDLDGCPDLDNDNDTILDGDDGCPLEPEDKDRFEDDDGCPDEDNDTDGILDAEDKDGIQDDDGCPEDDRDGDGLMDRDDECPDEPEDEDGFEDDDGCPENDNDSDGIVDAEDKCPDEKEIYNGVRDDDGCPDKGRIKVVVSTEKIIIKEKIYFEFDKAIIKKRSHSLLNQVAGVVRSNPQITSIEIQGHTDDEGSDDYNLDLSQARAEAVRDYLVEQGGVDSKRLKPVGYGETQMLCVMERMKSRKVKKKCREKSRRVEFVIKDQDQP